VSFLDVLISQSIAPAEPGSVRPSLLLTPQGKMRALLWVLRSSDEEVGLVTQSTTVETVIADLTRFRFRVEAEIELDPRPALTLVGPGALDALLSVDVPRPNSGWLLTAGGLIASVPFANVELPRFLLVGDAAAAITQSAIEAAADPYEAVRVAAGEPLGNVDFDDSTIAHELGPVDEAVDFTKGCYLGQELVARIDSRGRVTRRLRAVVAETSAELTGATLISNDKDVGIVTSSAANPTGSGTLGLALIRHEVEDATTVEAALGDHRLPVTIAALPILNT